MIRITAKPGNAHDTIATSTVKSALAGAESTVDGDTVTGARNLIRRALADVKYTATAMPNGTVVMNTRGGLVVVATWKVGAV